MSWISGPCDSDQEPVVVVFEDRGERGDLPTVERNGNVVWIDSGSGPGFEVYPEPPDED